MILLFLLTHIRLPTNNAGNNLIIAFCSVNNLANFYNLINQLMNATYLGENSVVVKLQLNRVGCAFDCGTFYPDFILPHFHTTVIHPDVQPKNHVHVRSMSANVDEVLVWWTMCFILEHVMRLNWSLYYVTMARSRNRSSSSRDNNGDNINKVYCY